MIRFGLMVAVASLVGVGCGDDGSSSSPADGSSSAAGSDGSGTSAPATSGTSATSGAEDTTTSATSPPVTSDGTTSGTTGDETYFCNGWDEEATRPYLELYSDTQMQTPLQNGGTWPISCGGQGSWMFAMYPAMGGFVPAGGMITFSVDVQVEGFSGPTGQFYLGPMYLYAIECSSGGDTFDGGGGGSHDCIAVLPPDRYLADLSVLDGAIATVHVDMLDTGGTPVASADFTDLVLSAPMKQVSEDCFF